MKKVLYYLLATIFILAGLFFTGCGGFATLAGLFAILTSSGGYGIEFIFLMFGVPGLIAGGAILSSVFFIWKKKTDGKKGTFLKIFGWLLFIGGLLSVISLILSFLTELILTNNVTGDETTMFVLFLLVSITPIFIGNYILNFVGVRVKIIDSLLKVDTPSNKEKDDKSTVFYPQ